MSIIRWSSSWRRRIRQKPTRASIRFWKTSTTKIFRRFKWLIPKERFAAKTTLTDARSSDRKQLTQTSSAFFIQEERLRRWRMTKAAIGVHTCRLRPCSAQAEIPIRSSGQCISEQISKASMIRSTASRWFLRRLPWLQRQSGWRLRLPSQARLRVRSMKWKSRRCRLPTAITQARFMFTGLTSWDNWHRRSTICLSELKKHKSLLIQKGADLIRSCRTCRTGSLQRTGAETSALSMIWPANIWTLSQKTWSEPRFWTFSKFVRCKRCENWSKIRTESSSTCLMQDMIRF